MMITFSLLGLAFAITGLMAFAFFWPMTLVHLRDRYPAVHAQLGAAGVLAASSLLWLLAGRFHESRDPALDGLGTPARIALIVLLIGLACALGFGLIAWATKP
jgi:hypothetical protein